MVPAGEVWRRCLLAHAQAVHGVDGDERGEREGELGVAEGQLEATLPPRLCPETDTLVRSARTPGGSAEERPPGSQLMTAAAALISSVVSGPDVVYSCDRARSFNRK
jgi:hypothetical protein